MCLIEEMVYLVFQLLQKTTTKQQQTNKQTKTNKQKKTKMTQYCKNLELECPDIDGLVSGGKVLLKAAIGIYVSVLNT